MNNPINTQKCKKADSCSASNICVLVTRQRLFRLPQHSLTSIGNIRSMVFTGHV